MVLTDVLMWEARTCQTRPCPLIRLEIPEEIGKICLWMYMRKVSEEGSIRVFAIEFQGHGTTAS